jgi:hypothetical protein
MNISADNLRRAASIKDKIESLQSELDTILGGGTQIGNGRASFKSTGKKRRKMSAAARAKIAAAQRARWARARAGKQ